MQTTDQQTDQQVAESGGYELVKARLAKQGLTLEERTTALNAARLAEFGESRLELSARVRARTENNCVARDIVRVGDTLLFGYNVFLGLKQETDIADVFSLYRLDEKSDGPELTVLPLADSFLADTRFVQDFRELYGYYKEASLLQLRVNGGKLLAAFKTGPSMQNLRVFRWELSPQGEVRYIDNRGERDMAFPPSHDFEWQATKREQHVLGRHPHVNILDTVFVETVGGDLTVKVENNTETGLGVYSEPVDDANQSLMDADIQYARTGGLLLLKVKPYREAVYRYLVFNPRSRSVQRIDAIGQACISLPEDQGIIFPGGIYLASGEYKDFGADCASMSFKRLIRSPNGEDVLYVFSDREAGRYGLFPYNMIHKRLANPIVAHGYAIYPDGRMLVFAADSAEATRLHPMQIWATPFHSDEHAAGAAERQSFLGRLGNSELVRGIAELFGLARSAQVSSPARVLYEDLEKRAGKVANGYFWLASPEVDLAETLKTLANTARLMLDEFDKVEHYRRAAAQAMAEAEAGQTVLVAEIKRTIWKHPRQFTEFLDKLRQMRGKLLTFKDLRYIDSARLATLDAALAAEQDSLGESTVRFLSEPAALTVFDEQLDEIATKVPGAGSVAELRPQLEALDGVGDSLDLLTETLGALKVGDAVLRTQLLDTISSVYARVNQLRAEAGNRSKQLGVTEARAEFGAQLKLFGQSLDNGLNLAATPEACDEQLARLVGQLEELEGRFGEHDAFLGDILGKREAVFEAFEAKRQTLLAERQQRLGTLRSAAERLAAGVNKKVGKFADAAALQTFFAADQLVLKLRELIAGLRGAGDNVNADQLEGQLKAAQDQAVRALRDQSDIFEDGGKLIRLGKHRFSVSQQAMELALVVQGDQLCVHLAGTDYTEPVNDARLDALRPYWGLVLPSESPDVYRAEFLAWQMLQAASEGRDALSNALLDQAVVDGTLAQQVQRFAAPRYQEGYQKGVHDEDAAKILAALLPMRTAAGALAIPPLVRAVAQLFWSGCDEMQRHALNLRARQACLLQTEFDERGAYKQLVGELTGHLDCWLNEQGFGEGDALPPSKAVAAYLVDELGQTSLSFVLSAEADDLAQAFVRTLTERGHFGDWRDALDHADLSQRWRTVLAWITGFARRQSMSNHFAAEAVAVLLAELPRQRVNAVLEATVEGLLGQHAKILEGKLVLTLDDFAQRLRHHVEDLLPGYEQYQHLRSELLAVERERLRLKDFQAKPLNSFVRNKLIFDVYLPLAGANFAKQIGTVGDSRRVDQMGLLLLISPPGYGKTTLMEYLANRLGLVFVRVNCPSLGHEVTSLDPADAPNVTARQELEKLNLALVMGNNVMLYLDDIQHTNPEFLQKFISLCDATRRIDSVWNGQPRTCDLRGKKFAIVMAGNPYTESGDVFKIPDMLANRADIYNLGDVLSGKDALFALSYIENCLTSNVALAPLANRDPEDLHRFLRMAAGEEVLTSELSHPYGQAEIAEIVGVLQRLLSLRNTVMKVNAAYIASAAQADAYRTEPPFKLQGSYRNMAKLAEKVNALQNEQELAQLLADHYQGEAQTLTAGAEENLLRLSELRGGMTADELDRWSQIKRDFQHKKRMGGDEADGATKLATQLSLITGQLGDIHGTLQAGHKPQWASDVRAALASLGEVLAAQRTTVNVAPPDLGEFAATLRALAQSFDTGLVPVVRAMNHKARLDHDIWDRVQVLNEQLQAVAGKVGAPQVNIRFRTDEPLEDEL
ncbi:DNA repair ATPase [Chitinimonas sp. PSY-7]|uniref:DNA repair ATPase n=1 Tax=Chitinimonas sp. PSY-7 TaxID=3459088 RepID=UPI00403FEE98